MATVWTGVARPTLRTGTVNVPMAFPERSAFVMAQCYAHETALAEQLPTIAHSGTPRATKARTRASATAIARNIDSKVHQPVMSRCTGRHMTR